MNEMDYHRDHYLDFQIKRDQLMRDATHEHLVRIALQRSPKTRRSIRNAITTLINSLFR